MPPTGDEVRPIGAATGPGEILDTNSLMLVTQAREAGCEAYGLPIEPDDPAGLAKAVSAAVPNCDLLIIVAGSSAGRDDYTARIVAERFLTVPDGLRLIQEAAGANVP